jgi:chromosome segregation ATPase
MKPGEVVVSRRLYRSGQSEYLINGRVGRLRDIQEMFMGVGLGPDSYAIIEQGRIGLILSTKPMERRAIIEEAAGVTKFKTKKRLAEAKLESSKVNLSRVNARPPKRAAIPKSAIKCAALFARCWRARLASWTPKPSASLSSSKN